MSCAAIPGKRPSRLKAWVEAMRLRTLPVSVAGVVAGCGCALLYGCFRWLPATICMLFAIIAQIVSNFANEYYDYRDGLDKKGRDGFRRGVTEGDLSPRAMKRATFLLLALDALLGSTLILFGGWQLIFVGLAVAVFAICYSTGPWPLSRHGLGDIAVIVFFGIVPVCFTYYVQAGSWDWRSAVLPMSLSVGMMANNVLIVNNYRDADDDRAVDKRTLVVILGRRAMGMAYLLLGLGAVAISAAALYGRVAAWGWALAGTVALLQVMLWLQLTSRTGKALNPILGKTAMLLLAASLGLAVLLATS